MNRFIFAAASLCLSFHAIAADKLDCAGLVRLDALSKLAAGNWEPVMNRGGNNVTCSYSILSKGEVVLDGRNETYWPATIAGFLSSAPNAKVEEVAGIGKHAVFINEAGKGGGVYGKAQRTVKATTGTREYDLSTRIDGDDAAVKAYLIETMKHILESAP